MFENGEYVCRCSFEEREIPRRAGFRWNPDRKKWFTPSHVVAARLAEYADENTKAELQKVFLTIKPWSGPITIPEGLSLIPFQEDGVRFLLSRNRAYLAADPGLGKTIMAAVTSATIPNPLVVYVCPPFLVLNTQEEFKKWAPNVNVHIIGDSMIHRPQTQKRIREIKEHALRTRAEFTLFLDEAHRFKNAEATRTEFALGLVPSFDRTYFLSGTPMPNRPMELYPMLSVAAPETIDFMNKFEYGRKYCAGHKGAFGWDFSGASNMGELAKRIIGRFMLRLKKDLLKLPPKMEEMVVIAEDLPTKIAALDAKILDHVSGAEDLMSEVFASEHVATYRRELGLAKVKPSLPFLRSLLEETDEALIVFAYHREVISELAIALEEFYPLIVTGDTPKEERHEIVRTFQTDPTRKIIIGNYLAAGIGFTLTKATRVVFVEFSWVPADNDQASDRAHRIGQTDTVTVQYLLYKNSIDRAVMETNFRKKAITKHL